MSDTITTSDGRTVPLDGLEQAARAATPGLRDVGYGCGLVLAADGTPMADVMTAEDARVGGRGVPEGHYARRLSDALTPDRIAELREKKSAYDAAIARIKAIDPTPIDPRFPEHMARICSQNDVNAMDRWNTAIRNHADALLDAADEVAKLRAEVESHREEAKE